MARHIRGKKGLLAGSFSIDTPPGTTVSVSPRKFGDEDAANMMRNLGREPLVSYPGNGSPWLSRCMACGAIASPSLANLRKSESSCGECRKVERRRVEEPKAIAEMLAAGLRPLAPYENTRAKWECECMECGAIVEPTLGRIRKGHSGCKACAKKRGALTLHKTSLERNNLAVFCRNNPDYVHLLEEARFDPESVTAGAGGKVPWRCRNCGHEWSATCPSRTSRTAPSGCPECGDNKRRRSYLATRTRKNNLRDFCDKNPEFLHLIEQADGFDPSQVAARSRREVNWCCQDCGHKWSARIVYRTNPDTSVCPSCSPRHSGYNPAAPAAFYILQDNINYSQPGRKPWSGPVTQYGISNVLQRRLNQHKGTGFVSPPQHVVYGDGAVIAELERRVGEALRGRGVRPCANRGERGFGGATESFGSEQVPLGEFIALVDSLLAEIRHRNRG